MLHFKLQLGCLILLLYVVFVYIRDTRKYDPKHKFSMFDALFTTALITLVFDGLTAYMVNNLDAVNPVLNLVCHVIFLIGIDAFIFNLFVYVLSITDSVPKTLPFKVIAYSPFVISVIVAVIFAPELQYLRNDISNYSMGVTAYTCFAMAAVYSLLAFIVFCVHFKRIESHKRASIVTALVAMIAVAAYQIVNPYVLLTSICITIIVLGVYINEENPAVAELERYHKEMVMGFATLVENKDGSTGGHIKRTSIYVELLTEELKRRGHYKDILTKDYTNNLYKAAPMHDIGKVAVPDVILQKPGKLTTAEFESMKFHTVNGGKIIKETFEHLGNDEYAEVAYHVAMYHHEKWNGKGYPEGLQGEEIPLCARIMAIADVFDAVSMNRCYRAALPIDECFEIIEHGRGEDFDPLLVDIFMDIRPQVETAYHKTEE